MHALLVEQTHSFVCETMALTRWIPSIHPSLRVLRHVNRRGLDWFWQHWSFCLDSSSCFGSYCALWRGSTNQTAFSCNSSLGKMDCRLYPSLRVIRRVYKRGLDWFQQPRSFRLGYSCVLVHFGPFCHKEAFCTKRMALLQFLIDEMDCQLPPCLRVLRRVYRRGLDWIW